MTNAYTAIGGSEEIASADAMLHELAVRDRAIETAKTQIRAMQRALAAERAARFAREKLIGRLDYFLETYRAQPDRLQRQMAASLRREIATMPITIGPPDD